MSLLQLPLRASEALYCSLALWHTLNSPSFQPCHTGAPASSSVWREAGRALLEAVHPEAHAGPCQEARSIARGSAINCLKCVVCLMFAVGGLAWHQSLPTAGAEVRSKLSTNGKATTVHLQCSCE